MPRVSNKEVQESRMRVLRFLGECTRGQKSPVPVSYRVIAQKTDLSRVQVRSICGYLDQKGLVRRAPSFAADGGQMANAFSLTPRGWKRLREYEQIA